MAANHQNTDSTDAGPIRFTGRSFASIDPERVREMVPGALMLASAQRHESPPGPEAGLGSGVVPGQQVTQAAQGGNQGGIGNR